MNCITIVYRFRSQSVHRICEKIHSYNVKAQQEKIIVFRRYYSQKKIPGNTVKSNQFSIGTIQADGEVFLDLKRKNSTEESAYTLADQKIFDGEILGFLLGTVSQSSQNTYRVHSYRMDSFLFEFITINPKWQILIVRNQLMAPLLPKLNKDSVNHQLRIAFEEILSKLVGSSHAIQMLRQICRQVFDQVITKHPETYRFFDETCIQVNFSLIKNALLAAKEREIENMIETEETEKAVEGS